jgi:hypothetical protein
MSAYDTPRIYTLQTTARHDGTIDVDVIAERVGLLEAIESLRCVLPEQRELAEAFGRLFAARVAFGVLPIFEKSRPGDDRPRNAIRAARRFAIDEIDATARAAARDAAKNFDDTKDAASSARGAARAAAGDSILGAVCAARDATEDVVFTIRAEHGVTPDNAFDDMRDLFIDILRGKMPLNDFPSLDCPACDVSLPG